MNSPKSSTLPLRNPIARPVSFHSLSEHNRNGPTYLSPYSHRRPRTPRSSPLAGPSLSSEEVDGEKKDEGENQKPRYRPNRISSTPDMVPRVQSLYESDSSSFPSSVSTLSTGTSGIIIPPFKSSDSSSSSEGEKDGKEEVEDGSRLRNFAKRLSIVSTTSLTTTETDKDSRKATMRRSDFLRSASSTSLASTSSSRTARTDTPSQTAPPIPTIPRWALNAMREEAGMANRSMKYGHRRGTSDDLTSSSSLPPLPNQPIPRGVPLSASGLSNQQRLPSTSRDPSQNWVSMTDPTPRFSRLGLRGEGVVLPVSKKESLSKMKSSGSIKSVRSMTSISQPTDTRPDNGTLTRSEPTSGTDSNPPNVTITEANLKEGSLRKRSSLAGSLKSKIPRISVSLTDAENVPPIPPSIHQSDSSTPSISDSHTPRSASNDSARKAPNTSPFPTIVPASNPRRSTTSRKETTLAAIDELPSPLADDSEIGVKVVDAKPQDTQKRRARRKSIKQIVMRVTMAPISAGEKLKFGAIHKSTVVLPPDTLIPLDPPPATWLGNPASSSVPSLASTVETLDGARSQCDARAGGTKFKNSIKKRWNAVLATVRR